MSTSSPPPAGSTPPNPPPTPLPPTPPAAPATPTKKEVVIISHCSLFYWWPVWVVGYAMFLITAVSGEYMVTVPKGTTGIKSAYVDEKAKTHDAWVLPATEEKSTRNHLPTVKGKDLEVQQPYIWMSASKNLGVFFCAVLLLVIGITNIPLRGLWSVIVIVFVFSLVIIFAILEWWAIIFHYVGFLDIRINAAGYFVISSVLLVLWLVVTFIFDRQVYMVFTPGQLRIRQEIGDAESAFDTAGMQIQKQRSDLFRHWILGIGSGDLIVKTSGAHPQEFHMNNVLFIGRKVAEIEKMMSQKSVVTNPMS